MKTKIFLIVMLCLMLLALQGAMLVNAKMGSITFHVFKDIDDDKVFDTNEPSPPWTVIKLKTQCNFPIFYFLFNRIILVGGSGDVTCRFIRYPCDYHLVANYWYSPDGTGTELWYYESSLCLDENNIGTKIDIPLKGGYVP